MDLLQRSPLWLGFVAALVLAEALWRLRSGRGYDPRTALTTLGVVVGNIPFGLLNGLALAGVSGSGTSGSATRSWRTA